MLSQLYGTGWEIWLSAGPRDTHSAEIVLVPAGYLYGPGTAEPSNKVARVVMDSDDKLATN